MSIGKDSSLQGKQPWRQTRSLAFPVSDTVTSMGPDFKKLLPNPYTCPSFDTIYAGRLCRLYFELAITLVGCQISQRYWQSCHSLPSFIHMTCTQTLSPCLLQPRGTAAKICFWNYTTSSWTWSESKRAWGRVQTFGLVPVHEERQTVLKCWWNPNFPQPHFTCTLHLSRTASVPHWPFA